MEYFVGLNASVVGATVTLNWKANQVPGATSQVLQRAPYGQGQGAAAFTTIASPALSATSATDSPGVGDWTYRLAVTTPQGGVDQLGTVVFSNNANISTEAATGVITLSVTSTPSVEAGFTRVTLTWTDPGIGNDLRFDLNRVIGSTIRFFERLAGNLLTYTEELPTGSGAYSYQVVAVTPPESIGLLKTISTSNTATITI